MLVTAFLAPRVPTHAAPATGHGGAQPADGPAEASSMNTALSTGFVLGVVSAAGATVARRRRPSKTSAFAVAHRGSFAGGKAVLSRRRLEVSCEAKKSVEDLAESDLKGKKVLIRCDLNVPMSADLEITDTTRITASIPTIEYLCKKGAKVIACSHLGRPKDGPEEKFSLKPVAKKMSELMDKDIKCAPDCKATDDVKELVDGMSDGDVLILENTRFYKGETKNDAELAESMASLADLFVNDAFGTAHRAHSSTEGVTKFLKPNVSGFLLKKELDYLQGAVDEPKKPMAAIVGGAKVSTKIPVIESMLDKVDKLVIGGGMVFTFLKARGLSVGDSLVEEDYLELAQKLEKQAKEKGVELILPVDIACGDAFPAGGKEVGFKVVKAEEIPDGWLGLDNGPKATEDIKKALSDCKTIIWNGPMGVFESSQFDKGTYEIAECLAELTEKKGAITIIGGGDSVAAVNKSGLADKMSHISTGGGASLELLEGKVLPGVAALDEMEPVAAAFCGQRVEAPRELQVAREATKTMEVEDVDEFDDDDFDFDLDDEEEDIFVDDEEFDDSQEARATAKWLKGSVYKYNRVLHQIKGKPYRDAMMMLEFMPWRACGPVLKVLKSAGANATNNYDMDTSSLYVQGAFAVRGEYMRRMRLISKGQGHPYKRYLSHVTIVLKEDPNVVEEEVDYDVMV